MAVYLVRPKPTSKLRSLHLNSRLVSAEQRRQLIQAQGHLWQQQSTYQDLEEWIRSQASAGVRRLPEPSLSSGIGLIFMEIPNPEQVEQLRQDLRVMAVPGETPLSLVRPLKGPDTFKRSIGSKDLWHLEALGGLPALRQKRAVGQGDGVKVAVLDTGVTASHPALIGRMTQSYHVDPQTYQIQPESTAVDTDPGGHGTHVAGLIGGAQMGIAPEVKMISGIVLPQGEGTLAGLVAMVLWLLAETDIRLINFSGGIESNRLLSLLEVEEAEILIQELFTLDLMVIAAVGNSGVDYHDFPANQREVISVGALTSEGKIAGFSGGGVRQLPDRSVYTVPNLVAPGERIYSCVSNGYESLSGTSMAAPIVTGVAAVLLAQDPDITIVELRNRLFEKCRDLGFKSKRQGHGLISLA